MVTIHRSCKRAIHPESAFFPGSGTRYYCGYCKLFISSADVERVKKEPEHPVTHPEPDLDNLFTHHPPFGNQVERYHTIRRAAREFAAVIVNQVPASPERSIALRNIREAMMWANAGIACNEKNPHRVERPNDENKGNNDND